MFTWSCNLFLRLAHKRSKDPVLSIDEQIRHWCKASRKMNWRIGSVEFKRLDVSPRPTLTREDRVQGFIGLALFYGFGNSEHGDLDAVLSGKLAWDYAL
jgi:hypothetical protein